MSYFASIHRLNEISSSFLLANANFQAWGLFVDYSFFGMMFKLIKPLKGQKSNHIRD